MVIKRSTHNKPNQPVPSLRDCPGLKPEQVLLKRFKKPRRNFF